MSPCALLCDIILYVPDVFRILFCASVQCMNGTFALCAMIYWHTDAAAGILVVVLQQH